MMMMMMMMIVIMMMMMMMMVMVMTRMVCARNTYNGGEDGDFDHDDDDHVERVVKFHVMEPE